MLRSAVWLKFTEVLEVLSAFIIGVIVCLMVEAVRLSEAPVNFFKTTLRSITESCHLQPNFYLLLVIM
jgi:hypothetical protein